MALKNNNEEKKIISIDSKFDDRDLKLQELQHNVFQLIEFVNRQTNSMKMVFSKIGEISFKIGKMDQEIQNHKTALRIIRDKLNINRGALTTLGIIDESIFEIISEMLENKTLPILSNGKINGEIIFSRYNHDEELPSPPGSERVE